jgi:PBP1b-binding outer membrane lipoprotein LpoB
MKTVLTAISAALLLSGCVRNNGTATFDPITDEQYQEAATNEHALAR